MHSRNYHWIYPNFFCPYGMFLGLFQLSHMIQECGWRAMAIRAVATYSPDSLTLKRRATYIYGQRATAGNVYLRFTFSLPCLNV